MPITRPALLQLGGVESFHAYEAVFNCQYRSVAVIDAGGKEVWFPEDSCVHVCFKEDTRGRRSWGRRNQDRNIWMPDRAARIPWIETALTHPETEVRPDPDEDNRHGYMVVMPGDPRSGVPSEYFLIIGEPGGDGRIRFITAYSLGVPEKAVKEWKKWRGYRERVYTKQRQQEVAMQQGRTP